MIWMIAEEEKEVYAGGNLELVLEIFPFVFGNAGPIFEYAKQCCELEKCAENLSINPLLCALTNGIVENEYEDLRNREKEESRP